VSKEAISRRCTGLAERPGHEDVGPVGQGLGPEGFGDGIGVDAAMNAHHPEMAEGWFESRLQFRRKRRTHLPSQGGRRATDDTVYGAVYPARYGCEGLLRLVGRSLKGVIGGRHPEILLEHADDRPVS
jgi:hypothetical protein